MLLRFHGMVYGVIQIRNLSDIIREVRELQRGSESMRSPFSVF
jgi:hypothetical protein